VSGAGDGLGPRVETSLAVIARDHGLPADVLLDRLGREGAAVAARITQLTSDELARVGHHAAWGDMSVGAIVERTLVTHLEGHVEQLRRLLGSST
jgi:hypothetical protein